jgi:hypothetical protein
MPVEASHQNEVVEQRDRVHLVCADREDGVSVAREVGEPDVVGEPTSTVQEQRERLEE